MIEDGLVKENKEDEYRKRIDDLEEKLNLIYRMCNMLFNNRLSETEYLLWQFEDRLDNEDLDNFLTQELVKERDEIEEQVYFIISLGHAMLENERIERDNKQEYRNRLDDLQRRIKLLVDLPGVANDRKPSSKRCRDYERKLRKTELDVSQSEQRSKIAERVIVDLQSTKKSLDDIKELICESCHLEEEVNEVVNEGKTLYKEEDDTELLDMAFFAQRMNRLKERVRLLKEWLHNEMIRLNTHYILLIKQHLQRLLAWIIGAEVKMGIDNDIGPDYDTVVKQLEEHMEFHKEVGLYSTVNMILEIDIDDPTIDDTLHQDVKTLSERWAAVWNWSEERKNRLSDVKADWEAFHKIEKKMYDWLVDTDEAIEMSTAIDISNESQVDTKTEILMSLINDIKSHEGLIKEFRETGEKLIDDAQYRTKAAEPIRDEINDFHGCWQTKLAHAQKRKDKIQETRKKFAEMADLKKHVNDWIEGAESLIDSFGQKRDDQEEQTFFNQIEVQCEERDKNGKLLEQINSLNRELEPEVDNESAKELKTVVDIMNSRWQDAIDQLDTIKDDHKPLTKEVCWPIEKMKNCLEEPGNAKVIW